MSAKEARKVVTRAVTDNNFRELLFENPDKALAGYQLTPVEVEALRGIPSETIDDFANNLDERISMTLLNSIVPNFEGSPYGGSGPSIEDASGTRMFEGEKSLFEGDQPQMADEFASGPDSILPTEGGPEMESNRADFKRWISNLASTLGVKGGGGSLGRQLFD